MSAASEAQGHRESNCPIAADGSSTGRGDGAAQAGVGGVPWLRALSFLEELPRLTVPGFLPSARGGLASASAAAAAADLGALPCCSSSTNAP